MDKVTALTDAKGHTTTFEYNQAGRLIKETDPLGYFKTHSYDGAGNRVSMTDENNNTTQYRYDPLNRLVQVTYPDGTTKTLGYEARGNMISAANPHIGYVLYYDLDNRLTGVLDSDGRSVSYRYDALNNRTGMTTPDGREINYSYDTGNRLSQIASGQGTFAFSYDQAGRRTGRTYPNGVTTTDTYNPASHLTSLLAQKPQSTVNSFAYTRDAVGNRISLTDLQGMHAYQYDPIYQLIQAVHPDMPAEQFSYDPAGNRLNAGFDEVGGIKVDTSYTYDYENRLIRIQYPGMDARYTYDPLGRRIGKNVNGQITQYVYDGANMIAEYDGSGVVKSKYLFNLSIDDPLSVEQGGSVYYYHKDGLGSVTEVTDSGGTVAKTYRYNSFGEIYAQGGSFNQPFTFTGREYDPESGLYFYRARYYDPAAGIFIGKDPIGFDDGEGNFFRYVGNNPGNWIDPLGLYNWDVHFFDTYILATLSGLPNNTAQRIGESNNYVDIKYDPWAGLENRENWHFVTYQRIYQLMDSSLQSCKPEDFGEALHVLQDYHSHSLQGYGPIWGHFWTKKPDNPSNNLNLYNQMIQATIEAMTQYMQKCRCAK